MPILKPLPPFTPGRVSHLACLKSCLDAIDCVWEESWLYGATGMGFLMNISNDVDATSPYAWNTEPIFELAQNLGTDMYRIHASDSDHNLREVQARSFATVQQCIDAGIPCYGWELDEPEYSLMVGYDKKGYFFLAADGKTVKGPKAWNELGVGGQGYLDVCSPQAAQAAPKREIARAGITFALQFASPRSRWVFRDYTSGPDAFDTWAAALKSGQAHPAGVAYNAAFWLECRQKGIAFLNALRADEKLQSENLDQAVEAFTKVAQSLAAVSAQYPLGQTDRRMLADNSVLDKTVPLLEMAYEIELKGLQALSRLLGDL